jgi:hypothetical protein
MEGRGKARVQRELIDADVGYYDHPLERLQHLHTGASELTTGFSFAPLWSSLHW